MTNWRKCSATRLRYNDGARILSIREPFVLGGCRATRNALYILHALASHRKFLVHSILTIVLVSYLLGSIPFGYLLVRIFRGQDVRQTGSGNIGATNVARTGSKGLAIATLLLDALKG